MNSGLRINNTRWIITTTSVLALFCFLYTITPDCFSIGLSGVSWLYIILCFVFFSIRRGTLRKPLYFDGCFIYSLISIILQTIHGEYASAFWTGVSLLLVPCIFVSEVKDKKVFFKLIDCVIYSGMIVCFLGIAEALTGFNIFYSILIQLEPLQTIILQGWAWCESSVLLLMPFLMQRILCSYFLWLYIE